jgi:hypothetical protein
MSTVYGAFEVVRTERQKPKRAMISADEDGLREYSFLKCPHCLTEDIEILSSSMSKNKQHVMRDHLSVCPDFKGELPNKRSKVSENGVSVISTISVSKDTKSLQDRIADLEHANVAINNKLDSTQACLNATNQVVAQHQVWWSDAATALGFQPPQEPSFLVCKIRELQTARTDSSSTSLVLSEKQAMLDQKDVLIEQQRMQIDQVTSRLTKLENERDEYLKTAHNATSTASRLQKEIERLKKESSTLEQTLRGQMKRDQARAQHEKSLLRKVLS